MNEHSTYDDTDLIGYCKGDDGHMYPIYNFKPDRIVTKAFILCQYCNGAVSTVGGPNHRAVCLECFKKGAYNG